MKILLIVVGCVVVLIATVAIRGMMLPQNHTASRRARFRQTPETLWTAVANYKPDDGLHTRSKPPIRRADM